MNSPAIPSARATLQQLANSHPVIKKSLPLAIGINKQLAELHPDISPKALRSALFRHTRSLSYLKAMEKAEVRFDLEGNPAGEVTEEQRQHAKDQLKALAQQRAEAKKLEEQKKAELLEAEKKAQKLEALVEKFGKH